MAHEGYRSPRLQPQSNVSEMSDIRYPPPPTPYSQAQSLSHLSDLDQQRPRGHSIAQSDTYTHEPRHYSNARQPINDAVTSAFTTTDNTNAISPELLNAITANVIQQLQATNMTVPPPPPTQTQHTNAGLATSPSTAGSPTDHCKVYTPPSPYRASEEAAQTVLSSTQSQAKNMPKYAQGEPTSDQRPISPQSQATQADDSDARDDRPTRPRGPKRLSTGSDPSIMEKVWGTLFNEKGQATTRLSQFLRGIAVHLIEDYEPKHSLVITPEKLQKYYEDTKLPNELYPWQMVFDDRTSSISRLYREIGAQHHLVQEKLDERPDTPGLTPLGFERWTTLLLLAHPDLEFTRLQKTALDMPISNPDDKKERFPKEISRRLFPVHEDPNIVSKIQKAMVTNCNISIIPTQNSASRPDHRPSRTDYRPTEQAQTSPTYPPPPSKFAQDPMVTPSALRSHATTFAERERKPCSNPPSEAAFDTTDDEDNLPTPQPIERERKPYVAQPGGGKTYDQAELEKVSSASSQAPATESTKLTRSSSIASNGRPSDLNKSRPIPITVHQRGPPSALDNGPVSADAAGSTRHRRSNSIYNRDRHGPRVRSPSTGQKDYGHRSEDLGSSYKSVNSVDPRDRDDLDPQARRYRDYERDRERLANDRFDAGRMAAYDPRDREHEPRQRFQSSVGLEAGRGHYHSDEEYYRAMGGVMGDRGAGHSLPQRSEALGRDGYAREAHPPNSYR